MATCLIWQVLAEIDRARGPTTIDLTANPIANTAAADALSGDPVGDRDGSGTRPGPTLLVVRDSRAASTLRAVCRYGSKAAIQSVSQPASQSVSQPASQSVSQSVSRSVVHNPYRGAHAH